MNKKAEAFLSGTDILVFLAFFAIAAAFVYFLVLPPVDAQKKEFVFSLQHKFTAQDYLSLEMVNILQGKQIKGTDVTSNLQTIQRVGCMPQNPPGEYFKCP